MEYLELIIEAGGEFGYINILISICLLALLTIIIINLWKLLPQSIRDILIEYIKREQKKDNDVKPKDIKELDSIIEYIEHIKQQVSKITKMEDQLDQLSGLKESHEQLVLRVMKQDVIINNLQKRLAEVSKERDEAIERADASEVKQQEIEKKHTQEILLLNDKIKVLEYELQKQKSKWDAAFKGIKKLMTISDKDEFSEMVNSIAKEMGFDNE